jgi:hypothetical protein
MAENEVVHVVVAPPTTLDEELVKKVVAVVGKSHYETQLRLTGKIPKIIANYDIMSGAELAAKSLRELGLVVIVVSDSELRKPPEIFKARSLKFEDQAVMFGNRSNQSKRIEARDMFLILRGKMQTYTETEVTKTTRKLNITATLLTGGIPITKKVKEKSTKIEHQTESYIRLYDRTSPERVVQIQQHEFDYSFLGTEMVSSAAVNFTIVIRKIREAFPQAIFNESLVEPFGAKMPADTAQEIIEANCKLIYWYHQAVRNAGPPAVLQI